METLATEDSVLRRLGRLLARSGLVEGGASALALMAFVFVWRIPFLVSLALALGAYFGLTLLRPSRGPEPLVVEGLTAAELEDALADGRARVARIELEADCMPAPDARARVHAIACTADNVLTDFKDRPRHLPEARFAFYALLDATVMALDRYQKFSRAGGAAARRGREVLEHRILPTIDRGFRQLLEKLLQDDLRAVDVDAAVLERLLDLEGLAEDGEGRQGAARNGGAKDTDTSEPTAGADVAGTRERR